MTTLTAPQLREAPPRFDEVHVVDPELDPTRTLCGLDAETVGPWVALTVPLTCAVCADLAPHA